MAGVNLMCGTQYHSLYKWQIFWATLLLLIQTIMKHRLYQTTSLLVQVHCSGFS